VYWGEGWEDPVSKQLVNRALRVVSNDSSIPMEELTDFFDWLYFEEDGGVGKVKRNADTLRLPYCTAARAGLLRAVRTGGTGQLAPRASRTVRTPYAYQPRACRAYRVPCGAPQALP